MTTPTTKIVIVAGQEFSVPAETDNEAIRTQLTGMGFADVASATIQTGKKTVDGTEYPTVEFIKKAGTKGLSGSDLAALLRQVPQALPPAQTQISRSGRELLQQLVGESLTYAEALGEQQPLLNEAFRAVRRAEGQISTEGEQLCASLDGLPAVAALAPCAW